MLPEPLIDLARRSPPHYAYEIRQRNMSLLESLMLLEPYLGLTAGDVPDEVLRDVTRNTRFGCPHCKACGTCNSCAWLRGKTNGCMDQSFMEPCDSDTALSLTRVQELKSISVHYHSNVEYLSVDRHSGDGCTHRIDHETVISADQFAKCKKFLDAHIEWADLDCWGADIPQTKQGE